RIGHARDAFRQIGLRLGGLGRDLARLQVVLRGARQRHQVLRGAAHRGHVAGVLLLLGLVRALAHGFRRLGQALAGLLAGALRALRVALLALLTGALLLLGRVLLDFVRGLLQALLRLLLLRL